MTETLTTTEITGVVDTPAPSPLDFTEGVGTTSPGYALPFLFAWVRGDQTTFDETMMRVDEDIVDMELEHEEGQIPTLSVTIRNPRAGLLNLNRYQWAWIAYQPPNLDPYAAGVFSGPGDFTAIPNGHGSSGAVNNTPPAIGGTPEYVAAGYVQKGYQVYDGETIPITPPVPSPPNLGSPPPPGGVSGPPPYINGNTVVPIFFGELIGVPDDLFAEKVTLKFLARSMNYIQWKQAVAETLRKSPENYDPVFLKNTERDNPDKILEGWSKLYHVDRCSLAVSASDVLVGEDGTVVFTESPPTAVYESVKLKRGQAPLTDVQVQMDVHWTQRCNGAVSGPGASIASYTGGTLMDEWPKPGSSLGAGWTVTESFVNDVYLVKHTPTWNIKTDIQFYGDMIDYDCAVVSVNESSSGPALMGPALVGSIDTTLQGGFCDPYADPPVNRPAKIKAKSIHVPLWSLNCSLGLYYEAKRKFSETLVMDVKANTQAVLLSPRVDQDTDHIKIEGDVGEPTLIYEAWTDFRNSVVSQDTLIYPNNPTTGGGLSYQVAITSGKAGNVEPDFSSVPGTITPDGTNGLLWASLGEAPSNNIQEMAFATTYGVGQILNYTGQIVEGGVLLHTNASQYYLVIRQCRTKDALTEVTVTAATSSDQLLFGVIKRITYVEEFEPVYGSMVPLYINPTFLGIPAGGTQAEVIARCYFPTARGRQSLVYGINRARAKIRMRSRAVEVSWECPIEMVLGMSCRMNATLYDPRLPGGVATGKVIKYGMTAKAGKIRGKVTIGCSVGHNAFGSPDADISYTPPVFQPFDDGLVFPLNHAPAKSGLTNTLENQAAAIEAAIPAALIAMAIQNPPQPMEPVQSGVGGETIVSTGVGPIAAWQAAIDASVLPTAMSNNGIGWSMSIESVVNGPFAASYVAGITPLELPQGIDLSANSENA